MGFEVRHDVPFAQSAGLAALAGTAAFQEKTRDQAAKTTRLAMQLGRRADMQHQSIEAAAQRQQQQIEAASAQAHQQAEYAKDQIGLRSGLQEELQDQKFSQEIERMEIDAQQKAQQWEWKLDVTAKKKQNEYRRVLAQLNDSEAMAELGFDVDEVETLKRQTWSNLQSVELSPTMKEPQLGDNLQDSQGNVVGLNVEFLDEVTGDRKTWEIGSRGQPTLRTTGPYKDSKEYLTAKAEQERVDKRREKREAERVKLMTTEFQPMREAKVVPWGLDIKAGAEGPKRLRTREEADVILDNMFGSDPDVEDAAAPIAAPEGLSIPERDPNEAALNSFMYRTRNIPLTKVEKDLPPIVGKAQAFLAKVKKLQDTGKDISRMITTAQYANKILRAYKESLNANR